MDLRMLELEEKEYDEYEAREDEIFTDAVPVREAVSEVKRALNTQRIEIICDSTASLIDILYEHAEPPAMLIEGLEAIYELLATGAKADARLLDSNEDEAFEVTELCRGAFRKTAAGGIPALYKIPPREFENFVGELFAQHGLTDVHTTPAVADDGADIIAYRFQDGAKLKYIIQCKRYALDNRVGVGVVRELVGVKMDLNATHALLVTTSEFTRKACELARRGRSKVWGVRLINYRVLQKLLELID